MRGRYGTDAWSLIFERGREEWDKRRYDTMKRTDTQKEVRVEDLPSQRATEIVRDRQGTYGHPAEVYEIAAVFWSMVFSQQVTVHQVAECLALVKHAREINANYPPSYRDNRDDMAGYANVAQMIHEYKEAEDSGHHQRVAAAAQRVVGSQLSASDPSSAPAGDR